MKRAPRLPAGVNVSGMVFGVFVLGLWQLLVATGSLNLKYLPSPWDIITNLGNLFTGTDLWSSLGHTVGMTLLGWAIASTAGIVIGTVVGLIDAVWRWTGASFEVLRSLPAIAMLPIAVVIFGLSAKMELVLIIYVAFWPVLVNTIAGVRAVNPLLRDVAASLQLRWIETQRKVRLPSAVPQVFVGVRLALALSLVMAVVSEIVANPAGIGYQLTLEQQALQPDLMFGCIFIIGLVGVLLNSVLVLAMRRLAPGMALYARITRS